MTSFPTQPFPAKLTPAPPSGRVAATYKMTVAELFADPLLREVDLVAGATGLDNAVTDIHWYTGDFDSSRQMVVLCGPPDVAPAFRLDAMIHRAVASGVAAIVMVGLEPMVPLLSSIRLADEVRLPVARLESADPLALLQQLTVRVRAADLSRVHMMDVLLRNLVVCRSGQEILSTAAKVLSESLSLIAPDGSGILGDEVDIGPSVRLDRRIPQRDESLLLHPVLEPVADRLVAHLACRFDQASPSRIAALASGLAIVEPFVRSWLSAERAGSDRDALYQQGLLAAITADRETVSHDVVEGALSLGWNLTGWHVGIQIVPDDPVAEGRRASLLEQFVAEMERLGLPRPISVDRGDSWLAWASLDREPGAAFNRQLLRAARVAAAATDGGWRVAIGIGRAYRGPGGLADTLQEARDAADLARSSRFRPMVEHIDELGVAKLLATWQRSEVTQAFADTALGPLRDAPRLLETLRAFLEGGGSVVDAAAVLGVHRNTVAARLSQIEGMLGVSLADPSQRLALQVACRALS